MRVRCKTTVGDDGISYDLTVGTAYHVIGLEANWYRICGDEGRPYLYPPETVEVVEDGFPSTWKRTIEDKGDVYWYPEALDEEGFFESYFDGRQEEVAKFNDICEKHPALRNLHVRVSAAMRYGLDIEMMEGFELIGLSVGPKRECSLRVRCSTCGQIQTYRVTRNMVRGQLSCGACRSQARVKLQFRDLRVA